MWFSQLSDQLFLVWGETNLEEVKKGSIRDEKKENNNTMNFNQLSGHFRYLRERAKVLVISLFYRESIKLFLILV